MFKYSLIVWYFVSNGESTNNIILSYNNGIKNIVKIPYALKRNGIYRYWLNKMGIEEAEEKMKIGKDVRNTWIDIPSNRMSRSANNYPTQKPYKLMERIICLSTK